MALNVKDGAGSNRTLKTTVQSDEHISHHNIDNYPTFGQSSDNPANSDSANDTHMAFLKRISGRLTALESKLTSIDGKTIDYAGILSQIESACASMLVVVQDIKTLTETQNGILEDVKDAVEAVNGVMQDVHNDALNSINVTNTGG